VLGFENIVDEYENLLLLIQLGIEEEEDSILSEVKIDMKVFISKYDELMTSTLLSGEYDINNAIVTLHSGAGGTEACDWVNMLFRMYTRWSEKKSYSVEILDYQAGEEAGAKSITFQVNGENAFGYLNCEKGVHRLVRMSPFDSSGRRHTSFASCDVMPELDDSIQFDINTEELRIDTYRASGAGGQHVNKTESAVRITHIPTNTVVQCQNERSQHKNKDRAMKMLKAKLYELKKLEQKEVKSNLRGEIKEIGFGSQIRSYVFHPYNMVKDHRTNEEVGNVQAVMDGSIDIFINTFLSKSAKQNNVS
jgi:peptide chain release factor 2